VLIARQPHGKLVDDVTRTFLIMSYRYVMINTNQKLLNQNIH
jgi:hypothetical protein